MNLQITSEYKATMVEHSVISNLGQTVEKASVVSEQPTTLIN